MRCSPGCTVLITAHKASKVVTATAFPTGLRPGRTPAPTAAAGTAAVPTPAVSTATAATVAAGMPEAGTAAAISEAETSAVSDVDGRIRHLRSRGARRGGHGAVPQPRQGID